jgi:hypothetical protein
MFIGITKTERVEAGETFVSRGLGGLAGATSELRNLPLATSMKAD